MKLFQWHFGLYLIPLAFLLPVSNAQAAATYDCKVVSPPTTTFSNITPANINNAEANTPVPMLTYQCKNTNNQSGYVSVCFSLDGGDYGSGQINPRYMSGPDSNKLKFNMYINSGIWGNGSTGVKFTRVHNVIANGQITQINGAFTDVVVKLLPDNLSAIPGQYHNKLTITMSWATTDINNVNNPDCNSSTNIDTKSFTVSATVIPHCQVTTTGALDFGSVLSSKTPTTSANLINVTCSNTIPYNIGLASLNNSGNNTGAGIMKSTGTNTDIVPYQLQSNINGKIWGNTATSTNVGNGVAGIGSGFVQQKTVFATVSNTDVKPDDYSDIVNIRVNY